VNRETIARLDRINREFYAAHAEDFLATRASPWPGWERLLVHLRQHQPPAASSAPKSPAPDGVTATAPAGAAPLRILDVGCGNGRLGSFLAHRLDRPHHYVGLDRSLALLRRAHGAPARILADLVLSGGGVPCRAGRWDAVLVLAFLHHVPSFTLRRTLLSSLARLLRVGGLLVLSCWQFATEERFAHRALPLGEYNQSAAARIDPQDLEPGDYLLRWGDGRDAAAVRYCHHTSPEELGRLLGGVLATPIDDWYADGKSSRLNWYVVLRRS
jgi:SAM-dependent methyltransferase